MVSVTTHVGRIVDIMHVMQKTNCAYRGDFFEAPLLNLSVKRASH